MADVRELYERVALDLTKVVLEQTKIQGKKLTKDEVLQTYIDSYRVVLNQTMPSKDSQSNPCLKYQNLINVN